MKKSLWRRLREHANVDPRRKRRRLIPWREQVEDRVLLSEFRVNTFTGLQQDPVVAVDSVGNHVVVWNSYDQDNSEWGIFGQRYNAAGIPQGSEFQINTYATGFQLHPAVAMDSSGDFVVVWSSLDQDGDAWGVYAQRYNASGVAQGGEFRVNGQTTDAQRNPVVAMDSDGDFVIAWQSRLQDGGQWGIYARRYSPAGVAKGGEFLVNNTTIGQQYRPTIASDAVGNFVVAWESEDQDNSGDAIYARRYNSAGAAQGAEFRVNSTTTDHQVLPAAAMDSNGDFVIAWSSQGQDGSGYGVYAQRYNPSGVPQGGEFRVNSFTTGDQGGWSLDRFTVSASMDSAGNFAIAWPSVGQDGSGLGVYAQRYSAAGAPRGSEFRLNSLTADDQFNPSIALDSDGDIVAVWPSGNVQTTSVNPGAGSNVIVRRFNASGVPQGAETRANSYTGFQDVPAVAADADGDFVVVWQSWGVDDSAAVTIPKLFDADSGVSAQRFNSAGVAIGPEFRVNTYASSTQGSPSVAMDSDGDFVVVWESFGQDGSGWGVFARRYDAAGQPLTPGEFQVNTFTAGAQISPSVAMDADGDFVVTWQSWDQDGSDYGVHAQRFNSAGVAIGSEFRVNTYTTNWQHEPDVAMDADGDFVITWQSYDQDASLSYGVYAQRYDKAGVPQGVEFRVNTFTTGDQKAASVALDADGDYVVTWQSYGQDGSGFGVYARRYTAAGAAQGNEFLVNTRTTDWQTNSDVSLDADGDFVVTWQSYDQDGSYYGVYARRFSKAGAPQTAEIALNTFTTGDQRNPAAAVDADGDLIVTWRSFGHVGTGSGIYADRFDTVTPRLSGPTVTQVAAGTAREIVQPNDTLTRSDLDRLVVSFSENLTPSVTNPANWNLLLNGQPLAGAITSISFELNPARNTYEAVLTLNGPLRGGQYILEAGPGIVDLDGNALDGDRDGVAGGVFRQAFTVTPITIGPAFQVNSATTGQHRDPSIATERNGDYVVVWAGNLDDGQGYDIYAQRFTSTGAALGSEFRVNTFTTGDQGFGSVQFSGFSQGTGGPEVAMDADGDFVVTWTSYGQDGSGFGVYAQRYNSAGLPQGGEFQVNAFTNDNQINPRVAMDTDGDFVVTWQSYGQDGSGFGVYARRYTAAGVPQGNEFRANSFTTGWQHRPSVAMKNDGAFVLAWMSYNQSGQEDDIYIRGYDAAGSPVAGEARVNTQTLGNQTNYNRSIAMNAGGDFVVVWESLGPTAATQGIFGQRFSSNGQRVGGEFRANTFSTLRVDPSSVTLGQVNPTVAIDADGDFVVSWISSQQDGSSWGTYAQRFNSFALPQGAEFRVNAFTTGPQLAHTIAMNAEGDFLVGWHGQGESGVYPTVYLQKFGVAGVKVTPMSGLVTTEAGGTASFTIELLSQPSGEVTIGLDSSNYAEGRPTVSSLVFTPLNWNVPRLVTVMGVNDNLDDGDILYTIITSQVISTDARYQGLDPADVSLVNNNDDLASVAISPLNGLVTTEAGGTASFTVRLTTQPNSDVSIALSSNNLNEGTISTPSLVFTPANWNVAQVVTVTGVNDDVDDGDVNYSIVPAATVSSDPKYNGLSVPRVNVANTDDDAAGFTVTPTSGLTTSEAGATASFSIRLNSKPLSNVSIGLSSSRISEGTVAPGSLVFTPANWNVPRTVTVTGVDDDVDDGDAAYSIITAGGVSTDPRYSGLNPTDVAVINSNDDVAGILVEPLSGLITSEAGATATFSVRLRSRPTADVTLGLSSSNVTEGVPSANSLVFTPSNWNEPQVVTVTGVNDDVDDDDVAYTIVIAAAVSTDTRYNGLDPADLAAVNQRDNNDVAGIVVAPTTGLITSEAGGAAGFSIRLQSQPTANVTIGLSSTRTNEGVTSVASLLFTPANWNVPQTVTVTGVNDDADDGDAAYSIITSAAASLDPKYDGRESADVSVVNVDNDDPPAVTITSARVVQQRVGRRTISRVVISFSAALNAATAQFLPNFLISQPGRDRRLGTRDDVVTRLSTAVYDPNARTVTITPRTSPLPRSPRPTLRVRAGVLDALGRPIDGNRDGQPGGDFTSLL